MRSARSIRCDRMAAIVIDGFGEPEAARLAEIAIPHIGRGDVLVRMATAGINPADWKCCAGRLAAFPAFRPRFPFVPGFDGAGIVADIGEGVEVVSRGERVFVRSNQMLGRDGAFAGFVALSSDGIAPVPPSVGFVEAATVPTAGVTAWQCLAELGPAGEGEPVFIHGGASATGVFAMQFARAAGARVAASCSARNRDYLMSLGAEIVVDYRSESIRERVPAWAPGGVSRLVDAIGNNTLPDAPLLVKPGGSMAQIETLEPDDNGPDIALASSRGVRAVRFSAVRGRAAADMRSIAELMAAGKVLAPRTDIVAMADIPIAMGRLKRGMPTRKQVAAIDPALVA